MFIISKKLVKLPKRKHFKKKGDAGRVLVVGGSIDYVGAVYLAAMAALRSGVDSVIVMAPEKVSWVINALTPDLITKKLKGNCLSTTHHSVINKALKTADVLLIGNGVGLRQATIKLIRKIIKNWSGLKVIDADAIKVIKNNEVKNAIITPNKKEWEIFQQTNNLNKIINQNNVLLIKNAPVKIISKGKIAINKNVNKHFTKAGIGDVLAGLGAGFLAQSKNLWQSAINASYFTSLIGNILIKKKKGYFYLASEMISEIKKIKKNP